MGWTTFLSTGEFAGSLKHQQYDWLNHPIFQCPWGWASALNLCCKFENNRRPEHLHLDKEAPRTVTKSDIRSGQIIATSHDLTPKGGLVRQIPLFQGKPYWWNIVIWPDIRCACFICVFADRYWKQIMGATTCLRTHNDMFAFVQATSLWRFPKTLQATCCLLHVSSNLVSRQAV